MLQPLEKRTDPKWLHVMVLIALAAALTALARSSPPAPLIEKFPKITQPTQVLVSSGQGCKEEKDLFRCEQRNLWLVLHPNGTITWR